MAKQKSIGEAQKKLLATDFLDSLGSSNELSDLEIDASLAALYELAGYLVKTAGDELNAKGNVASGALMDSIKVLDPKYKGKSVTLDIEALKYYQFLNKGVKGTQKGSGKFAFKNNKVSTAMMFSIRKWLIREGIKARTNTGKAITKKEAKRKSITETSNKVAYAIAVSIKKKGIKKTGFMDKAIKATSSRVQAELGKAFKIDIINSLPTKIDGTNS